MKTLIFTSLMALILGTSAAHAHGEDEPGPNGGFIRMPGAFHNEVASERLLEAKIRNLEYRKAYYLTKLKIYELVSSDPSREEMKAEVN